MKWKNKKIHCVGIKGAGLSGLAILLKNAGANIAGSDTAEEFPAEAELAKNGIPVKLFSPDNITKDIDFIIYSSAWPADHAERARARELKIPEMSYAEALGEYAKGKTTIVITGTHGKTTTTALLGQIFEAAGLDPDVLTGDAVKAWRSSVRSGKGEYFIVEGDEYQEKFKVFSPVGIIIPSLDYDHPDYFKDAQAYKNSFDSWIKANPQAIVVRETEKSDEKIFSKAKFIFPGEHYRRNALLAIKMARLFGIGEEKIILGINNFKGVGRRLDFYSPEDGGKVIIYDYAHHPAEIKATLAALKGKYKGYGIVVIFQPHTYTRTKAFLEDFAKSFGDADEVYFDEIYASAREKKGEVTIDDLIHKTPGAHHFGDFRIEKYKGKTLFVFMGAGDIWQKAKELSLLLFGEKGSAH